MHKSTWSQSQNRLLASSVCVLFPRLKMSDVNRTNYSSMPRHHSKLNAWLINPEQQCGREMSSWRKVQSEFSCGGDFHSLTWILTRSTAMISIFHSLIDSQGVQSWSDYCSLNRKSSFSRKKMCQRHTHNLDRFSFTFFTVNFIFHRRGERGSHGTQKRTIKFNYARSRAYVRMCEKSADFNCRRRWHAGSRELTEWIT